MPLRPVPWATSGGVNGRGGAENIVELARADTYVGSSGATGIVEPEDLKVSALPTPGAAVRVVQGTAVIKSLYPGVFGQSYVSQEQSYSDLPVAATGSSGGLRKYVYIMIEDSQYRGQVPVDEKSGPYNSYQVATNLPTFTPYILLAEINQPASTATITQDMIVDRRRLAMPRREEAVLARPRVNADNGAQMWLSGREANGGEWFPGGGGFNNGGDRVIPSWANSMIVEADWMSLTYIGGKRSWGSFWIEYGDEYRGKGWTGKQDYEFSTQRFGWDNNEVGSTYRSNWRLMDTRTIPAKLKGKRCSFIFKAGVTDTTTAVTNAVRMDAYGGLGLRLTFLQEPADWQGFN